MFIPWLYSKHMARMFIIKLSLVKLSKKNAEFLFLITGNYNRWVINVSTYTNEIRVYL